jgi:beta-aspartyl-peptidase (threonine type)
MIRALIFLCAALAFLGGGSSEAGAAQGYRRYVIGNLGAPTPGPVSGGLLLLGGGDRDDEAMRWFFGKAGNGHIVVLRASYGPEIGREFYRERGGVRSVETYVFSDRSAARDRRMLARLKRADGIFIAGGDQSRYVRFWKGTAVAAALDAHIAAGKPLAGTSAGLAILGEQLYGAMDGGSLTSAEALLDPFGPANTIERDFLHIPLLRRIVTDTHFKERDRLGRLFAFLAKAQAGAPAGAPPYLGLGVDESAAVAVEADGSARVYPSEPGGGAWLVDGSSLRNLDPRGPLRAGGIKVIGIGPDSRLRLPAGIVERPTFTRFYAAAAGKLSEVPARSLAIRGGAGVLERGDMVPARINRQQRIGEGGFVNAGRDIIAGGHPEP